MAEDQGQTFSNHARYVPMYHYVLIALRFAGDGELPDLVRTVLTRRITDRTAIKKMAHNWQPDRLRA